MHPQMRSYDLQANRSKYNVLSVLIKVSVLFLLASQTKSSKIFEGQQNNNFFTNALSLIQMLSDCKQYYPRLFYTQSPSTMLVKFNTLNPCNKSYVTISNNNSISKYYCNSKLLKIGEQKPFVRYIQNCHVRINLNYSSFNYTVYGQSGDMSRQKIYFNQLIGENYKQSLEYQVQIPKPQQQFNMIVLADWGPMRQRQYQPIYPSLSRQISQKKRKIHAMMIIGDVAYNLDTQNCTQYELFMTQLSQVSPYLPIIPILGNHQTFSENNIKLFTQTLECYNLSTEARVQAYNFWNFKLITFDPFYQIYNVSNTDKYQKMRQSLLKQLDAESNKNKFVVISSHYPIICSQDVFHCQQTLKSLPQLYKQMSQLRQIDLYLGAHMHQYERIRPYINGKFVINSSSSTSVYGKGQMISIVEGVAGCDVGIIDEQYPVQNFSIKHSYNRTGYGILSIKGIQKVPVAIYTHYITPTQKQTLAFDNVTVDIASKNKSQE